MPKRLLLTLTCGIVLIPCMIEIYSLTGHGYGLFVLRSLFLLAFAVAGFLAVTEAPVMALAALQILYAAWFCRTYGGLTDIAAVSPVFLYFQLPQTRARSRWILLAFHLAAINFALQGQPQSWIAVCNIFLFITAFLLAMLGHAEQKKETAELHYDALRKKHYELDETRNRLVLFTKQVEGAAQAEERNRISRQLHDDVGHRLIRAKMMMEAALQVIPEDQEKGMTMLRQIRDQLTSGLDEMRAAVRRMKPSEAPAGIHSLSRMLEEVGRETGIRTGLTVEGNPYPLYPSQEMIMYKNAREAITNALKHGHPASVTIVISYREQEIWMAVSNDGVPPASLPVENAGLGLAGMRERCVLAGGRLEIALEPVFTITTKLPVIRREEII